MSEVSNYQQYQDAFDDISKQKAALSDQFDADMQKLDTESASQGLITIMTSLLIVLSEYQETCMEDSLVAEDALRVANSETGEAQGDQNQVLQDWQDDYTEWYNILISGGYPSDSASYQATVQANIDISNSSKDQALTQDAYNKMSDVDSIMSLSEFSSISGDVDSQTDSLFTYDSNGNFSCEETLDAWIATEAVPSTSSSTPDTTGMDNLNIYTTAYNALFQDFQGMGNSEQDNAELYKSQDDQVTSLDSNVQQMYTDGIKYMVQNEKPA